MSATDKKIHSKKLKLEDINIDTPRIMDQEWIEFLLDCNCNTDNKVQDTNIINTDCNVIKDITWMGGHNIVSKDIPTMLFENIKLALNMEEIIIKENVLDVTFKDCDIAEVTIKDTYNFCTLIIKDTNIDMLRIETANVKRIYLINSTVLDLFITRSIIPYGILMNYNSSIGRLYMNNSFINNETNKTFNETYKDNIKNADDIIMDDRLVDAVKYEVILYGSSIIETVNEGRVKIDKDIENEGAN